MAKRRPAMAHYYDIARRVRPPGVRDLPTNGQCDLRPSSPAADLASWKPPTAGGDAGAKIHGLNITPSRTNNNRTLHHAPDLCFQFRYFALRKMHFLLRAERWSFFPAVRHARRTV